MKNPFVSIVIPVHNGANYMREAIDSALAQTYNKCEIIVVNDGSTDNTEEIALTYGDKIRYFSKENGGVSTALNLAIEKMHGEYFSWLSHDDVYYPDKIERQITALRDCGDMTRIVWGDYDVIDGDSVVINERRINEICSENLLTDSVFPIISNYIGGCELLIHKSHFERAGLFRPELRYTQDYDLWFRMFYGQRTVYLKRALYMFRSHGMQGMKKNKSQMNIEEAALYSGFASKLSHNDMTRFFGSVYEYYRQLYFKVSRFEDEAVTKKVLVMLRAEPIPPELDFRVRAMKKHFFGITSTETYQICIFCTGVYGLQFYYELTALNIKTSFFADNDSSKHGNIIADDIVCLSLQELEEIKNSILIIVANKQPEAITAQLRDAGFSSITTKQEVNNLV
jgi:glycosyltransferase involved in cell wall biosynthesis